MIIPTVDQTMVPLTNQVLVQKTTSGKVYYLPAYLRLKIKSINDVSQADLSAKLNCTIIFTIFYGEFREELVEDIAQNIILQFNRNDAILLDENDLQVSFKHKKKQRTFTYTLRKILDTKLIGQVFWAPFELLHLIVTINIRSINIKYRKEKITIKFNMMNHPNTFLKVSFADNSQFGFYALAPSMLEAEYTNSRLSKRTERLETGITKKKNPTKVQIQPKAPKPNDNVSQFPLLIEEQLPLFQQPKIRQFQYAHFEVALYRRPGSNLMTIFFPLMLLGVINLGIFYQDNVLGKRFLNIAALMISYVALIPTVRRSIPPGPTVTFIQILVLTESMTTLLCLIESIIVRNDLDVAARFTNNWFNNGFLITSFLITILVFAAVVIAYVIHKLVWEPGYFKYDEKDLEEKFDRKNWGNQECDAYFDSFGSIVSPNDEEGMMQMREQGQER